jgi:hypothetical protein
MDTCQPTSNKISTQKKTVAILIGVLSVVCADTYYRMIPPDHMARTHNSVIIDDIMERFEIDPSVYVTIQKALAKKSNNKLMHPATETD